MSFNDGKQLLVFGLSFAQHDNRKMQQLLRHYDKLPDNPGNRASLFVQLNKVARELMANSAAQDQIQQLTDWMTNGGDFPLGAAPAPAPTPANPDNEARPAQATNNLDQPGFLRGRQGYYGHGRTLSGQQNLANAPISPGPATQHPTAGLGRQYGRGRTISGDWEENNDDDPEEHEHDGEEEGIDASTEEEDEDMDDPMDGFPFMPGRRVRLGGSTRETAFTGPGRTLDDPTDEAGAVIADNEDGTAESMNVEGQVADRPQNQTDGLGPRQLGAAFRDRHAQPGLPPTVEYHEDETLTDHEEDLDHDPYETGPNSHQGEPDNGEEIECPICLEDYPRSRFPKHPTITKFCDHPDKACLNCLDSSIAAIVERGALHLLACPICPQRLSRRDVKEYANRAVYERYKYLKEQSEIPGHYISCTNPICGGSQPHESEDPMMICNHCKFATCAKHRRPWHDGQTCEEFDLDDAQIERLEEEEATAKLLSREAMSICPKCGQGVTKSDGCDHMRCQCGQEWCYVCSCSYENIIRLGPSAHATFCTYHPNKVNLTKSQQDAARSSRIMGLVHGGEAAEAAEARMRLQKEQNKGQEAQTDGPPDKKKRKVKLVAPWEEGGWTKKAL
ncbi:hypothetical protein INS49_007329 [Diaporthe citri]|uniref:uncharacterized protein n=1 Tax=Diaporthe citri TaxID=83186 RepID=UPI001C7EE29D|nr:uncharacterized protein INS49_007329 [Diaporthe citri]KAG6365718.1 hypothetical protein INS49_007329 [Diaporthe citri]